MRLLIVTQIVDSRDPVLGFFHQWIRACAQECESIEVVCLYEGVHALGQNVQVHSLGKEKGVRSKVAYTLSFYKKIWKLRKKYDAVFVHMNPEYVELGGILWRLLNKKIGLWYAHGTVTRGLRIATFFCNYIFTSTGEGFRIKSSKTQIVGQGIDTNVFSYSERVFQKPLRLLTVGRVSSSKDIMCLIKAVDVLVKKGVQCTFSIVGNPITHEDALYLEELKQLTLRPELSETIFFKGGIQNSQLPHILREHDVFIHAGKTGSLDKALLEALASGLPTISSNDAYRGVVRDYEHVLFYEKRNADELAEKILAILSFNPEKLRAMQKSLREDIVMRHSIQDLMRRIMSSYYGP